jgi:hypothetical protein
LAPDDYLLNDNVQGIGPRGYDWIGWKKKSSINSTVHLQFFFDTVRRFNHIHLHASNLFTRDIYLFIGLFVSSCDDSHRQYHVNIPEDHHQSHARFINISLPNQTPLMGNCLKMSLLFHPRSKWILLSEVLFDSVPIDGMKSSFPNQIQAVPDDQQSSAFGK